MTAPSLDFTSGAATPALPLPPRRRRRRCRPHIHRILGCRQRVGVLSLRSGWRRPSAVPWPGCSSPIWCRSCDIPALRLHPGPPRARHPWWEGVVYLLPPCASSSSTPAAEGLGCCGPHRFTDNKSTFASARRYPSSVLHRWDTFGGLATIILRLQAQHHSQDLIEDLNAHMKDDQPCSTFKE